VNALDLHSAYARHSANGFGGCRSKGSYEDGRLLGESLPSGSPALSEAILSGAHQVTVVELVGFRSVQMPPHQSKTSP
jgi:hypothetical protein